jgi:hypothetical protein
LVRDRFVQVFVPRQYHLSHRKQQTFVQEQQVPLYKLHIVLFEKLQAVFLARNENSVRGNRKVYQMCGQEVLEVGTTFDLGEVAGAQFSKEIVPRVSLPKIEDKHGVSVESVEHEV